MSAQRGGDPRAQDHRVERLGQIVVGAELDTLRNLVGVRVGADHDDRDISLFRIALDHLQDLRSEEHTSELQSLRHLVCRLLLEKKKKINKYKMIIMN